MLYSLKKTHDMEPLQWYSYEIRNSYPHMAVADSIIWSRFIAQNPSAFDAVAYDVAVGEGATFDTVVNPATGGHIGRLYQRRIDVVGKSGDNYFIIEVKPRASTAAIGQVKAYRILFERDSGTTSPVSALIVTDALLPEMEMLAKADNVGIIIA